MNKQVLNIILSFAFILTSFESFCQKNNEGKYSGQRTIKVIKIDKFKLKNYYLITALDSTSNGEFKILSQRSNKNKCEEDESLVELKTNKFYKVNLKIHPLSPLTLPQDSPTWS